MFKQLKVIAAGLAVAAASATASAAVWTHIYDPNPDVRIPPTHTWTHDLTTVGYEAGIDTLSSFTLTLNFYDDSWNDDREAADISIDGLLVGNGVNIDTPTTFTVTRFDDVWTWWINEISYLSNDGKLLVSVSSDYGDFMFGSAKLTAYGTDNQRVPEPASLALLGLGLAGVAYARRRRGQKKA